MPWIDIPINAPLSENVADVALGDNRASERMNIYLDEENASNKRAGSLLQAVDTDIAAGSAVQSTFEWIRKGWLVLVTGGIIYIKKDSDLTPIEITGATLELDNPVTFADNGTHLVMANGGKMVYTDGATATQVGDADAPTEVTHVAHINGFILATSAGTDRIYNSDLDDVTTWGASQYFSAESTPDQVLAMTTDDSLIYAWGEKTLEIWYPDGSADVTPFSRQDVIPRGIIAKYSVVKANNTFYWLNEERRLVYLNGAIVQSVSIPFDKAHHDLTTISDARAFLLTERGRYFIIINFPTEDRSHVYDVMLNQWYRWGYWDNRLAKLNMMLWNDVSYMQAWGKHIAASRLGDDLYLVSSSYENDNGRQIKPLEETGWFTGESSVVKKMPKARLTLQRGAVILDTSDLTAKPTLIVQWKDDGYSEWSNEYEIDLGQIGDTYMFAEILRLGQFRSRKFRCYMTDNAPFVIKRFEAFVKAGRD
jgi:hypothetical protein